MAITTKTTTSERPGMVPARVHIELTCQHTHICGRYSADVEVEDPGGEIARRLHRQLLGHVLAQFNRRTSCNCGQALVSVTWPRHITTPLEFSRN